MDIVTANIFKVQSSAISKTPNSPAFLAKLKEVEGIYGVHRFEGSWDNLPVRLGEAPRSIGNRAIYALGNPEDEDEALVSLQVALRNGYLKSGCVDKIDPIITCSDQGNNTPGVDTLVPYSITSWNRHKSANARQFIKIVVAGIRRKRPEICNVVTISPITGLRSWALAKLNQDFLDQFDARRVIARDVETLKCDIIAAGEADKFCVDARHAQTEGSLHADIANLARLYVLYGHTYEKEDRVATFHCGNDAVVHRLCPGANPSRGCADSFGIMTNFAYLLDGRTPEAMRLNHGLPCSRSFAAPLLRAA